MMAFRKFVYHYTIIIVDTIMLFYILFSSHFDRIGDIGFNISANEDNVSIFETLIYCILSM